MMEIQRQSEAFAYRIAAESPRKIYRRIPVNDLPEDLLSQIYSVSGGRLTLDQARSGYRYKLGPQVLDHLHNTRGGVGTHWTVDPDVTEEGWERGDVRPGVEHFRLVGETPTTGATSLFNDEHNPWGESEVRVDPTVPVNVIGLQHLSNGRWNEILHDPHDNWTTTENRGGPRQALAHTLSHTAAEAPEDLITLYHYTRPEIADRILAEGFAGDPVYFTDNLRGTASGVGSTPLAVQLPRHLLRRDPKQDIAALPGITEPDKWYVVSGPALRGRSVTRAHILPRRYLAGRRFVRHAHYLHTAARKVVSRFTI